MRAKGESAKGDVRFELYQRRRKSYPATTRKLARVTFTVWKFKSLNGYRPADGRLRTIHLACAPLHRRSSDAFPPKIHGYILFNLALDLIVQAFGPKLDWETETLFVPENYAISHPVITAHKNRAAQLRLQAESNANVSLHTTKLFCRSWS